MDINNNNNNNTDDLSRSLGITGSYSEVRVSSTILFETPRCGSENIASEMISEENDDLYLFIESSLHDFENLSSYDGNSTFSMDPADFQSMMLDDIISDSPRHMDTDSASAKVDFENVIQNMLEESLTVGYAFVDNPRGDVNVILDSAN